MRTRKYASPRVQHAPPSIVSVIITHVRGRERNRGSARNEPRLFHYSTPLYALHTPEGLLLLLDTTRLLLLHICLRFFITYTIYPSSSGCLDCYLHYSIYISCALFIIYIYLYIAAAHTRFLPWDVDDIVFFFHIFRVSNAGSARESIFSRWKMTLNLSFLVSLSCLIIAQWTALFSENQERNCYIYVYVQNAGNSRTFPFENAAALSNYNAILSKKRTFKRKYNPEINCTMHNAVEVLWIHRYTSKKKRSLFE